MHKATLRRKMYSTWHLNIDLYGANVSRPDNNSNKAMLKEVLPTSGLIDKMQKIDKILLWEPHITSGTDQAFGEFWATDMMSYSRYV